ncbi:MAG: cell division protein FtsQ [Candidatus Omnitrophica bacterium]|nr:cell division protein FtsQ [Candidatus Omnitrophota bacterium]
MARRAWRRHRGILPQLARLLWGAVRWVATRPALWALLMVGVGGGSGLWYLLTQTEAFRITHVEAPRDVEVSVPSGLIGRNIWTVDLQGLTTQLKARHPHLKRIRALRRLPQTLVVDVVARVPVKHPVALKGIGSEEDRERAVRIAEWLQRHPALIGHRLTAVDVQDADQLLVVLDDELEIRFGREEQLSQQMNRLRLALHAVTQRSIQARYIDLRFEEPVVGQKVAKK